MSSPIETMVQIEKDYWGAFNQLRIISTRKRFQESAPSHRELVEGWELYNKTKILETAYERISSGIQSVYLPNNPSMDILAKVRRKDYYHEENIGPALDIFHRDIFGTGEGGKATYLGKIRGGRKRAATNFFYAMEDLVKEQVAYVDVAPQPRMHLVR